MSKGRTSESKERQGARLGTESMQTESNKTVRPRVLIVTAVDAEKEAIIRGIEHVRSMSGAIRPSATIDVIAAGVGAPLAAVRTTQAVMKATYDCVISAGIGGAFPDRAELGSIVVSERIIAADLGAETADGFQSLDDLALGASEVDVDATLRDDVLCSLQSLDRPVHTGTIATLSTVTGSAQTATNVAQRIPGACAEAMEGFGVAVSAQAFDLPVIEIRTISNMVGPRNRDAWRIDLAMAALQDVGAALAKKEDA